MNKISNTNLKKDSGNPVAIQEVIPSGDKRLPQEDVLKTLTNTERSKKSQYKAQEEKTYKPLCPLPNGTPIFTKDTPSHHNKQFNSKPVEILSLIHI